MEEAVRREEEARKRTGEDSVSDGKWMTGKEVCEALGISSRTLQRYRMQGEVSYSQYGKNLRYPRAEIDAFVEKRLVRTTSEQVDRLTEDAHHARERCAELRVMIPHATYASYAAVDFLKEAAGADQLRIHIREGGSMEALDFVLRRGYHLALLRYAAEDDDHYTHYCVRRGLKMEPVMEFEYRLLTNRDGPLARHVVKDLAELNHYMEIMHDDFQLPGEDGGDGVRWHVNDSRRIHVYERCSQFSILQNLPSAYMWASPMPKRALEQYHLVLKKCPAQRQRMKDVLVYPDRGTLRPEEQTFVQLLHKQAALTVK